MVIIPISRETNFVSTKKGRIPPCRDTVCRLRALEAMKLGCVHCAHFGLLIGAYVGRIEPDSACFREFPVFAGEGMQFESHLGHVFSLFRGLWAADCVQISFMGPCGGPIFVGGGWSGGSFPGLGQRCCLLLHGRERLELHDLLRLGITRASRLAVCVGPGRPCAYSCPGVVVTA